MEFYIERFSPYFYIICPCEFVVNVDSEVMGDFCLGNHIIVENHRGPEIWTKEKSYMRKFVWINFNSPQVKPV